ncbi:MAG: S-layer homology domain-containing protein [Clostridia bacterium]|nr:S-layer homology domain-containing protein [Clostridia bacterium]
MKTKVLALIMSCLMLLSVVVSAASYSDVPETHDRYEAIDMLSSMDIITGYPDGTFQPDKEVTRAEMAALITRMFKLTNSAVTEKPFSDVEVDYWAVSNIVAAKNMNIINGFPDGTFQPQANVTYEQAVKMIVCALNYGIAAEAAGGYPSGYLNVASGLQLLNGAAYGNAQPAPRGIIAQLLYNSLRVDMLVPQVNSNGEVVYVKPEGGNSVMEQFQKTTTLHNVQVVRTPRVNLEPNTTAIQSVNSDALYIKDGNDKYIKVKIGSFTDAFNFIGQQVDISYTFDTVTGDNNLSSIKLNTSTRAHENIKLSSVVSLSDKELTYYVDRDADRTNTIAFSGNKTVLYNERLYRPASGTDYVTAGLDAIKEDLFNVTNDTYAEGVISVYVGTDTLIKAKSYKTYVVDSVKAKEEAIIVKGGVSGGKNKDNISITVRFNDTYNNETILKRGTFDFKTGAAASNASKLSSLTSISKGNLVSIAYNDTDSSNRYYEVLASNKTVRGTVTEMNTDDETGRPTITVGSNGPIVMSKELKRYEMENTVQVDANATFYLDAFGRVGYIGTMTFGDVQIGIPISVTGSKEGSFGYTSLVQMYNVDTGAINSYKVRDEETTSDAKDPRVDILFDDEGKLRTSTLFVYSLKSSEIEEIEEITSGDDENTYVAAYTAADAEVSDIKLSSNTIYFAGDKKITKNTATKIILIGSADEKGVTPKTTTMASGSKYTGKVYQLNNKTTNGYKKQYVIIRPLEGLAKDSPTYIVDRRVSETTAGVTYEVYSFTGTSKSGNSTAKTTILLSSSAATRLNLQKGDVITYKQTPNTDDVDIGDKLSSVYIVARASQIADGNYPAAAFMTKGDNAAETSGSYNNGYRIWGIVGSESELTDSVGKNTNAYFMGVPLDLAYEEDEEGKISGITLDIAKNSDGIGVMPEDAEVAVLEAAVKADGGIDEADYYHFDINSLANIYVYDANETLDDNMLQQIKGKDEVLEYLKNLQTIRNNVDNGSNKQLDTVFVKANLNSTNTLYNLFIIKDAR